ncbi:MAG: hypothetical protein AAF488_13765 [Planctomycetota bacterium]
MRACFSARPNLRRRGSLFGTSLGAVAAALLSFALLLAPPTAEATQKKALKQKQVTKLFEEFSAEATSADRRAQIIETLRTAKPKVLATVAKRNLRKSESRPGALTLIAELPVVGLFRQLEDLAEGEQESAALRAILASGGKGADDWILERWTESPLDDPSFARIDRALLEWYASPKVVKKLHDVMVDEDVDAERRERARPVIVHQMGLTEEEAKTLDAEWPTLFTRYAAMNQEFSAKGVDLLSTGKWSTGFAEGDEAAEALIKKYRGKILLEKLGVYRLPKVTFKDARIRVRLMVLEGEGSTAGALMRSNAMVGPTYRGGNWLLTESIRQNIAAVPPLKWVELDFLQSGSNLTVKLNGTVLGSTTDYGNQMNGLFFTAGQSRLLIGTVEKLQ